MTTFVRTCTPSYCSWSGPGKFANFIVGGIISNCPWIESGDFQTWERHRYHEIMRRLHELADWKNTIVIGIATSPVRSIALFQTRGPWANSSTLVRMRASPCCWVNCLPESTRVPVESARTFRNGQVQFERRIAFDILNSESHATYHHGAVRVPRI